MAASTLTMVDPALEPRPTKTGWHVLTFANGSYGVVRWTGRAWDWGSLSQPNSNITSIAWVGNSVQGLNSGPQLSSVLTKLYNSGFAGALRNIIASLDHGSLGQGQPVLWTRGGNPVGSTSIAGNEADPTNIIPSPIPPQTGNSSLTGFLSMLTSLSFWKGIGLVLAGAGIVIFAALEFRKIA